MSIHHSRQAGKYNQLINIIDRLLCCDKDQTIHVNGTQKNAKEFYSLLDQTDSHHRKPVLKSKDLHTSKQKLLEILLEHAIQVDKKLMKKYNSIDENAQKKIDHIHEKAEKDISKIEQDAREAVTPLLIQYYMRGRLRKDVPPMAQYEDRIRQEVFGEKSFLKQTKDKSMKQMSHGRKKKKTKKKKKTTISAAIPAGPSRQGRRKQSNKKSKYPTLLQQIKDNPWMEDIFIRKANHLKLTKYDTFLFNSFKQQPLPPGGMDSLLKKYKNKKPKH